MPELRRGSAAITAETKGSGDFKPFAPTLRWTENGEEKYVLVLSPISKTPRVQIHEFIKIGQRDNGKPIFGFWISRKDPGVGEPYDQLQDEFGIKPNDRSIGVGVELEPTFESSGRARPRIKGFSVKLDSFERKNEDGTTEEVTFPLVGIIAQAPSNFYNHLTAYDDGPEGPLTELPLKIRRIGKGKDTQYSFTPYLDQEVDLSNLVDHIDGISYIEKERRDEIKKLDVNEAAEAIADEILERRIEELLDEEDYETSVRPLNQIDGYKQVYHRNSSNGDIPSEDSPDPDAPDEDPTEGDTEIDKEDAFAKIRERANAKKQKVKA